MSDEPEKMDVDGDDDTEGEVETRHAELLKDGTIKFAVQDFHKVGRRVGNDHGKKVKRDEPYVVCSKNKIIDKMSYQIQVGISAEDEEEKYLSFFVHGTPVEKIEDWFCFIDAELRLLHYRLNKDPIAYSGPVVLNKSVAEAQLYGWSNFAPWDEVLSFVDGDNKHTLTVEVIIRNQIMFTVCDSLEKAKKEPPTPSRRFLDDYVRPLFNISKCADVFFITSDSDEPIPAIRLVIGAKCRVLHKLIYDTRKNQEMINLKNEGFGDIRRIALLSIFKFFYQSELILNYEILPDVYFAAKRLKVDVALETCKLFAHKDSNHIIEILAKATDMKLKKLEQKCWDEIRKDTMDFVKSSEFRSCHPDHLKKLLVSDQLSAPEYLIYKSCKAWAKNKCKSEGISDPSLKDLRKALGAKLHLIRFPLMKSEKLEKILQDDSEIFDSLERTQLQNLNKGISNGGTFLFSKRKRKPAD